MKYICLGYIEPGKFEGMTEDERHAMLDECFEYNDHLRANGHVVAEVPLQPPETAVTLYWKNGKVATTDGPYAETKEQLGGIHILEARDLNHAIQLMSQHPGVKYGWTDGDTAGCGFERNDKGERAATAKGYLAMRAATRESTRKRRIRIMASVLVMAFAAHEGHDPDLSFSRAFPRGRPHREVSFRRRSLSFMISLKSATGRISIVPHFMPGCCEIS